MQGHLHREAIFIVNTDQSNLADTSACDVARHSVDLKDIARPSTKYILTRTRYVGGTRPGRDNHYLLLVHKRSNGERYATGNAANHRGHVVYVDKLLGSTNAKCGLSPGVLNGQLNFYLWIAACEIF